jgi:hypothetical protein
MKKHLLNFCLLLGATCFALLLAEGIVRIFHPHTKDRIIPGRTFGIDDDLGWKFHPGKNSVHHTRYFEVGYSINAHGFRDRSRLAPKSGNKYRILLYGDSLIFGWGVPQDDRFSDILEKRIQNLEVWNRAIPGYGLDQEMVLYEREGGSLNADEVMFFVAYSTLYRIHTAFIFDKYKPMFVVDPQENLNLIPVPKGKNAAISLLYETISPFYLPYFIESQIANLKAGFESRSNSASGATKTAAPRRQIGEFEKKLLARELKVARGRNQKMTVAAAHLSQPDRDELRMFCAGNGIGYLELNRDLKPSTEADDERKRELALGEYDRHWNVKANRLIADQLMEQMEKGDWQFLFKSR